MSDNRYIKNYVTGHGIHFEINKRNHDAFDKASAKWSDINDNLKLNIHSVVMFCGAKNNGKSSLVRHVINEYIRSSSAANNSGGDDQNEVREIDEDIETDGRTNPKQRYSYAYYIDFDPGQPEMTTPGMVSAHLVKSTDAPLTSPTYLNVLQHEPIISSCVGGTNMSVNPKMYIENCRYVYSRVREHRSGHADKRPIFINTMGHIRNVGLAMLMDLIKICNPTNLIVLNVESDPMRTVYADLSPATMRNTRASFYYETTHQSRKLDYKYDVHNLDFAFVDSSSVATKNRTALQLAYFASIPEALYKPVMQLNSKWLPLNSISIFCVSSYPLQLNIVLDLLYHSWVHLVKLRKPTLQLEQTTEQQPVDQQTEGVIVEKLSSALNCKIIEEVGENSLLGCGIVADIDLEKERIAIITPVSQKTLDTMVDCLIKPLSIQVPKEILHATGLQ